MLIQGLFDYKIKMVTGYKGSSKSIFAMEQGESQMAAFNWLAWASKVPHWFTGDKPFARAIAQVGIFRDPDLPKSVPMINELVTDEMDKKVVGFLRRRPARPRFGPPSRCRQGRRGHPARRL